MSKVIQLPAVIERTCRSRSSIYRDVKAGKFPAPISLGERAIGWHESAIDRWIAERPQVAKLGPVGTPT